MSKHKVELEDGTIGTIVVRQQFKPKSDATQKKYKKRKKRIKPAQKNRKGKR